MVSLFTGEIGRILAGAATTGVAAALRSIPSSELAKIGLLRGPLVGLGPVAGAFIGGAATVAFVIPSSRKWMIDKAKSTYRSFAEGMQEQKQAVVEKIEEKKSEQAAEPSGAGNVQGQPSN